MKKIAGILAVAAIATSVFAADVSAKLRLDSSLFSYAKEVVNDKGVVTAKNQIGVLSNSTPMTAWYQGPTFSASTSSDKAGASFNITDTKLTLDHYAIWFKPFDAVKVETGTGIGNYALNTETIDYGNIMAGAGAGWNVEYNADGILIAANVNTSKKSLITKADDVDLGVAPLYFRVGYTADFGTVGAAFGLDEDLCKAKIGAGYANTFDSVSMFADVVFDVDTKKLTADAFVNTTVEEIGIKAYVSAEIPTEKAKDTKVCVKAKAEKAFDGFNGYLYVKNANVMADKFSMTVKPGITGNVGCMAYNLALDFTCAEAFAVAVPLEMSVAW